MTQLVIESHEELDDLIQWSADHATLDVHDWLGCISPVIERVNVPDYLLDDLRDLMNDWSDYLAAHDEPTYNYLTKE